ncbi:protein polyglycylase TTLL10-like [Sceloporus undulatus]|uniref:protein polyglycylase TTLL10-like n=1 Tax=Sceloporus undulatus TaxID=8520 RepID=UPI001C4CDB59|nr:protein polyglycylase TTLL10-like [Sceloporus undulatus]
MTRAPEATGKLCYGCSKVWLLEMNSNPALHTNCNALKGIIPTVVNETLDLVIEIFTKIQKRQSILPLESQGHFVLLYSGTASDIRLSRASKRRTSLHSFQNHRPQPEISTSTSASNSTNTTSSCSGSHLTEKQPPKALEKVPKGETKGETAGPPEGLFLAPCSPTSHPTFPSSRSSPSPSASSWPTPSLRRTAPKPSPQPQAVAATMHSPKTKRPPTVALKPRSLVYLKSPCSFSSKGQQEKHSPLYMRCFGVFLPIPWIELLFC